MVVVNDRGCNVSKSLHFFDSKYINKDVTGCCNSIVGVVSEPPQIYGKPKVLVMNTFAINSCSF